MNLANFIVNSFDRPFYYPYDDKNITFLTNAFDWRAFLPEIGKLIFRSHAIKRMFQRRVNEKDVRFVLETGEMKEEYPNDAPYPSRLVLGWVRNRPLHIVIADNNVQNETIIVTVYEPEQDKWSDDFRRRKQ